jgi:hypothetical protein
MNWDVPVGEVLQADPYFTVGPPRPGRTTHQCGTPEDFAEGGLYDPAQPPVVYTGSGFPVCCDPVPTVLGGGAGGGLATVVYIGKPAVTGGGAGSGLATVTYESPFDIGHGGIAWSGSAIDSWSGADVGAGGLAFGGSAIEGVSYANIGAGGVAFGGSATDAWSGSDVGAGGLAFSGSSIDSWSGTDTGAGGVVFSGSATDAWHGIDIAAGGLAWSGAAIEAWHFFTFDTGAGGVAFSGAAIDAWTWTDVAAGGVAFAGAATDVWTPGGVTPGTSCATAGVLPAGSTQSSALAGFGNDWWAFVIPSTGTYHVTLTVISGTVAMSMFGKGACPFPTPVSPFTTTGPPKWVWTATAGDAIKLNVAGGFPAGGSYTIVWNSGP